MKYVVAFGAFALLVLPVRLLVGDLGLIPLSIGCWLIIDYWPKAQPPGERTPDSTS